MLVCVLHADASLCEGESSEDVIDAAKRIKHGGTFTSRKRTISRKIQNFMVDGVFYAQQILKDVT